MAQQTDCEEPSKSRHSIQTEPQTCLSSVLQSKIEWQINRIQSKGKIKMELILWCYYQKLSCRLIQQSCMKSCGTVTMG